MLRAVDTKYTFEAADRLTTFDKPALVLWADNDKIFPREHGQRLAQLLRQGDFALIPDSPHLHPRRTARTPRDRDRGLPRRSPENSAVIHGEQLPAWGPS